MRCFETITDLGTATDAILRHRYGVIETVRGEFDSLKFRPWPRMVALPDMAWLCGLPRRPTSGDRCWLYFNQPRRHANFLALKYVISTRDCTLATFRKSLTMLDEVARIKQTDALLTDAANWRISPRLLARWGWEPHCPSRWHRNYIKRFYPNCSPTQLSPASLVPKTAPVRALWNPPGAMAMPTPTPENSSSF